MTANELADQILLKGRGISHRQAEWLWKLSEKEGFTHVAGTRYAMGDGWLLQRICSGGAYWKLSFLELTQATETI